VAEWGVLRVLLGKVNTTSKFITIERFEQVGIAAPRDRHTEHNRMLDIIPATATFDELGNCIEFVE
jgi:hypothetical protein